MNKFDFKRDGFGIILCDNVIRWNNDAKMGTGNGRENQHTPDKRDGKQPGWTHSLTSVIGMM